MWKQEDQISKVILDYSKAQDTKDPRRRQSGEGEGRRKEGKGAEVWKTKWIHHLIQLNGFRQGFPMTGVSVVQKFIQALEFTGLFILKPLSPFGALLARLLPQTLSMRRVRIHRLVAQAPNLRSQPPSSEGTQPHLCCLFFIVLFCFVLQGVIQLCLGTGTQIAG